MQYLWIVIIAVVVFVTSIVFYNMYQKKGTGLGTAGSLVMSFQTRPSVIEFGASESITPMFHELCRQKGRPILTVDKTGWSKKQFANLYAQEWHPFRVVNDEQMSRLARSADGWGIAIIPAKQKRNIIDLRRHADVVMVVQKGMLDSVQSIGGTYKYKYCFAPDIVLLSDTIDVQKIGKYFFATTDRKK